MWGFNMEYNPKKDVSTLSTSGVKNYVENVKSVENSKSNVENSIIKIPFIVHEAEVSRFERHIKRLWIALIIAVVSIVLCNVSWLIYINQYDFEDYEYTQDGTGVNIIGDSNGVDYYGAEVDSQKENQKE